MRKASMSDLPYPFSKCDEPPFYTVATGGGEYVWVALAGDHREAIRDSEILFNIACELYADLHPHQARADCEREMMRWYKSLKART